jgi:hypothetical protein
MSIRIIVIIAIVAMAGLAIAAWNMSAQRAEAPAEGGAPAPAESAPGEVTAPEPADPGLAWNVPDSWTIDVAGGMRLATYLVPASGGGEQAQCAVYYFGPGQGGGVEPNLQRWMGEFQPLDKHDIQRLVPGGITVTRISASGTYVAHSMRGPEEPGEKKSWALLGAVVEGPQGDVFFKLTGPSATVAAAAAGFDRMLGSMKKK